MLTSWVMESMTPLLFRATVDTEPNETAVVVGNNTLTGQGGVSFTSSGCVLITTFYTDDKLMLTKLIRLLSSEQSMKLAELVISPLISRSPSIVVLAP